MRIRAAAADDEDFILGLAPRLTEFGSVPDRDAAQMVERDRGVLRQVLEQPSAVSGLFVAEDVDAARLGFIHLTTASDYYTDSEMGGQLKQIKKERKGLP